MELAIIVLVYSAFIFSCSGLETSYTGQKSSHGSCDAKGQRSCPGLCDAKDPDPCNRCNYKILNSPDRAEGFMTYDQPKCDLMSWERVKYDTWYRFNGSAGTAMPTHCVETMRCGAEAPGWLYGGHPKAAEGISTRSVCFNWLGKCCYYKNEIKVKNCRGFFVYKFRDPPMNFLRYCGNGSRNGTGQVSRYEVCKREAKKERENPCLSGDYITLRGPSRAQGFNRSRRAKCDMDILNVPEAWYRFAGKAGTMMADKCVPVKHCGTNAPGWLRGPHPEDPSEGEVARTVCFHWKNNCCFWKTRVKVRNCGTFFIYYLKQDPMVGCSFRYCGNGEGPTPGPEKPTTQVSTSETKSPTSTSERELPTSTSETELPTSTSETESPTNTTKPPPPSSGVNVVCGKNEMTISIRKTLLKGIDVEHIRLSDVNCRAIENPTGDRFILQTELTKCGTKVRHAKNFVIYKNKVEEIPIENGQIVTRVREVEIPFSCYYSNTGVVSAVGLEVTSKKIIFSRKGFGQFILEMNIFPNSDFVNNYRKEDFPVSVTLRERLFVKVSVDTDDEKLEIMAETCFATPDPDPNKPALKYVFIEDGCTTDETVEYISSDDQRNKKFSLEAFKFLGEHEFVYMHCKVKICNAKDPNSRCAQGCLSDRQKRSLYTEENNGEEYLLAQGPFMRKDEINEETVLKDVEEVHDMNIKAAEKSSPFVIASTMTSVLCMMGMSYMLWYKKSRAHQGYTPVQVKAH